MDVCEVSTLPPTWEYLRWINCLKRNETPIFNQYSYIGDSFAMENMITELDMQ